MGGCVSVRSDGGGRVVAETPSAHVVSVNGDLLQYKVPITVAEVLQLQSESSPSSSFLCNSDRLNFDEYISCLKPEDQLQAGQIYFVLPKTKLDYKLSASDMAALAVKASLALQKMTTSNTTSTSSSFSRRQKNKKARISPVIVDLQQLYPESADFYLIQKDNKIGSSSSKASGLGVSRSGSVRKLQRYSSRRAKMAVRSFRLKLSTIYEGSVLQLY